MMQHESFDEESAGTDRASACGTLEEAVVRQLDQYFAQLGGSQPHPLYSLVITTVERPLLIYAMNMCGQNQCKAAELLGINRNTLRKKLGMHGLLQ